jgi:hypothetical protein
MRPHGVDHHVAAGLDLLHGLGLGVQERRRVLVGLEVEVVEAVQRGAVDRHGQELACTDASTRCS